MDIESTRTTTAQTPARAQAPATTQITVIGGTGAVGSLVTRLALDQGLRVRTLVRSPERLPAELAGHPRLTVVTGELADDSAVAAALAGSVAVVLAVGVRYRNGSPWRGIDGPDDVAPAAVRAVLHAVRGVQPLPQLVLLSAYGAGDSWEQLPRVARWVIGSSALRTAFRQLTRAELEAQAGPLPVAVVRAVTLTDHPGSDRSVDASGQRLRGNPKVSRSDVAALLLQLAVAPTPQRRTVVAA
jgi:nucleoside-diphosphate-sugar epimerase